MNKIILFTCVLVALVFYAEAMPKDVAEVELLDEDLSDMDIDKLVDQIQIDEDTPYEAELPCNNPRGDC
uniref:SP13 phlebotomine family member n=1 Tax=Nyssomyia intermedia TaxID=182990 RepID=J7HBQ3_9DIPT